jgi:flagellar basal-body rod protein FlgG
LITADGYPVRSAGGGTIQSASAENIEISEDGTVRQGAEVLGQIEVVTFPDESKLVKHGGAYFNNPDQANRPASAAARIHQGRIESSNVAVAESAVRMVAVMRQFEMLHKAVTLAGEMNRRAMEEVARVGS